VVAKLDEIIKVLFKLNANSIRVDNTPVHNAVREAVANAIINASYHDRRGIVIKRWPDTITIANPGGFRIPIEEAIGIQRGVQS
jgi:predicted HTH transcriptional regulator